MPSTDLLEEKIRVILRATCLPTVAVVWGGGQDPPRTEQLVEALARPGCVLFLAPFLPPPPSCFHYERGYNRQSKNGRPAGGAGAKRGTTSRSVLPPGRGLSQP